MSGFSALANSTDARLNVPNRSGLLFTGLLAFLALGACAKPFDRPLQQAYEVPATDRGNELFALTAKAHGADKIELLENYNISLSGQWRWLIKKIQPLVSDFQFRIDSEERLIVGKGIYSAHYSGPAGTKTVIRTPDSTRVYYNGTETFDSKVLRSTALTADAFYFFLLGPLALLDRAEQFVQLPNKRENGRDYYRIYTQLQPGFGDSPEDEIILWIDQKTGLTWRVHITLEGYETTKGAHADVTYLEYASRSGFTFPVDFTERVRGPIAIQAHDWSLRGLDINRDYDFKSLDKSTWGGSAIRPANSLNNISLEFKDTN